MARTLTGLQLEGVSVLRSISGVIAADSATLTLANFPVADAIRCKGLRSIFVSLEIDAGTNPTCTVEPLFYDEEATDAATGGKWKRILVGPGEGVTPASAAVQTTGALASGADFVELKVFGQLVYFRRTAVANETSTTGMRIFGFPGQRL